MYKIRLEFEGYSLTAEVFETLQDAYSFAEDLAHRLNEEVTEVKVSPSYGSMAESKEVMFSMGDYSITKSFREKEQAWFFMNGVRTALEHLKGEAKYV